MDRREETSRQRRVVDQMLTAYSILRDRYSRIATALTLVIFLTSTVLVTCTFLPEGSLLDVGISSKALRLILGLSSGLVLFASVAELALRWRELSQKYGDAADRLAKLKAHLRAATVGGIPTEDQYREMLQHFDTTMEGLPRIPDRQFGALKAYHLRKVKLSQMCDEAIGCPVFLLRLRLMWRGMSRAKDLG